MGRWRWRLLVVVVVAVAALAGPTWAGLAASTSRSQLARAIMWGESDMDDHRRFPARRVAAGADRFDFARPAGGVGVPPEAVRRISVRDGDRRVERDLEQFLAASDTTAFLIVRGDSLMYEGYFNGARHDAVQTSMSMAKSVLSALVGSPSARAGSARSRIRSPAMSPSWPSATPASVASPCGTC